MGADPKRTSYETSPPGPTGPADGGLVLESWERSLAAGLDPGAVRPQRIADGALAERVTASAQLLEVAARHIEWLSGALASVPHSILVVGADGVVLHATGTLPRPDELGLAPGFDWSERAVGANAVGIALALGRPFSVVGPQHFATVNHGWACVAAPLHGPDGATLAALNITTPADAFSSDRLVVVSSLARAIDAELVARRELSLREQTIGDREHLLYLLESERGRLEQVVRQMPAGVVIAEAPSGRVVLSNVRAGEIFGLNDRPEHQRGAEVRGWHDDGRPYAASDWPLARSLSTGEVVHDEEIEIERGDGTHAFVSASSSPVRDRDRRVVGAVGVDFDVTAHRRAEMELKRERDFSAAVLDTVGALVIVTDRAGRIVRFNRTCEEVTGWSFGEVQGRRVDFLMPENERAATDEQLREMLRAALKARRERLCCTRDGRQRLVAWSTTALRGADGAVEYVIATGIDVTDRQHAESERERLVEEHDRARRRAEALAWVSMSLNSGDSLPESLRGAIFSLAVLLGARAGALWSLEAGNRLRRACDTGAPATGLPESVAVEKLPGARAAIGSGEASFCRAAECTALEAAWFERTGGRACLAAPAFVGERCVGVITLCFAADEPLAREDVALAEAVAGQCAAAVDRAAAYDQVKREVELRERVMAILGHDLRNPLNVVVTAAGLLLRVGRLGEKETRNVQRIERAAVRIHHMIRDLLDFTRSRSGAEMPMVRRPADLREIAERAAEEMQAGTPGRAVRVTAKGDCTGSWDAERLAQALSNLLANALQHGAPEGEICVAVEGREGEVVCAVQNEGPPIPHDVMPRIFDAFQRGKREDDQAPEGLGLGLFIVNEIVRAHGGTIEVCSTPAAGTTFAFRLPRHAPA